MAFAAFATGYVTEPSRPSGGPMPGAVILLDWLCDDSPWAGVFTSLGVYNPRDICGNPWPRWECPGSQHARGAAGDAGCKVVRPGGLDEGWQAALWLAENHAVLGVQEVIFAGQRWTNQTLRWQVYGGRSDHYDHVHFALNASGARFLTLARITSVAPDQPAPPDPEPPPTPEDPLAALTDAEQRELLANSRATKLLATATNTKVHDNALRVVRRRGSSGLATVSLQWGLFRVEIDNQTTADWWLAQCGQSSSAVLPGFGYDTLVDANDLDTLAALIQASG